MILTDANGVPFERPRREDYANDIEFMRAIWAFQDRVASYAHREFAQAFNRAIKGPR
jgi:hypothetical protein